jgi:hypothetical protein
MQYVGDFLENEKDNIFLIINKRQKYLLPFLNNEATCVFYGEYEKQLAYSLVSDSFL